MTRAILALLLGAALLAGSASAKTGIPSAGGAGSSFELVETDPRPGSFLKEQPEQILLRFSRDVDAGSSTVEMVGPTGPHPGGPLRQEAGHELIYDLPTPLAEGTYFITWKAATLAGEEEGGRFHFTYSRGPDLNEPLDRREVNILLGDLTPGRWLLVPAILGAAGLVWALWAAWRE